VVIVCGFFLTVESRRSNYERKTHTFFSSGNFIGSGHPRFCISLCKLPVKQQKTLFLREEDNFMKSEHLEVCGWLFGAVTLVMLCFGTTAEAIFHFNSFSEAGDFSINQSLSMSDGDNLLFRVGGIDKSVADAGYGTGSWNLGLLNSDGYVVGWAANLRKGDEGFDGWLTGQYSGDTVCGLADGERPTNAILVYDALNDGWEFESPEGDLFFWTNQILFNGVLGDVSALPPYIAANGGMAAILPSITVVPEPATLGLLCIGYGMLFRRKRI
jgi:hypothetical protein